MANQSTKPNTAAVLAELKDFQRDTVDHIFHRLYLDPTPTRRFLVADEVGLGKTMVAKGLIARAIDHLWDKVKRVDIVYICSNVDIARQNIRRLNFTGQDDIAFSSRITLLPIRARMLTKNKINFVSFTPGTSFNMGGNLGIVEERVLLYWLLHQAWGFGTTWTGPQNVLQGTAGTERFRGAIDWFDRRSIDPGIAERFVDALVRAEPTLKLRERFNDLCARFRYTRDRYPDHDRWLRNRFVGDLRTLLAETCLSALEPDLIILDEFQRFKELLDVRPDADPAPPIALVTGANRGIGREVVHQLAQRGMTVVLGARDPAKGAAAATALAGPGRDVRPLALDVASPASIVAAAAWLERQFGRLDVLVNNAAVHYDTWQRASDPDFAVVEEALAINTLGPWRLTQACLPLLRRSPHPRIVNVSSGAGALSELSGETPAYSLSKAALNALTRMLAADLRGTAVKVNAVCPGWVATDMGGAGGRPVAAGAAGVIWAATLPDDGPTGGFFHDGKAIPW